MKNITLSVDEKSLRAARVYAAERDTTVNALVREFLAGFVRARAESSAEERAKAREELARLAEQSTGRLGPDWKWNREELYDRPVFSRHERPDLRRSRKTR